MPKPLSREERICLAIWRKAWRERQTAPLFVNCSNYSNAIATRQSLYRAIRPYRNGELFDEELYQASQRLAPMVEALPDKETPHKIIMKPKVALDELDAAMEELGLEASDLLTTEEKEAERKFVKVQVDTSNPFYERETNDASE